jgi:cytochrome c-type biogenesis protein CcsB
LNSKRLKNIFRSFFAVRFVGIAALFVAVAIGLATFIEFYVDKTAAWFYVYNATWFEILLGYIAIASLLNALSAVYWKRGRVGVAMFHASVFVIITGAGITRFFSETGLVHIRQGQTVESFDADRLYVRILVTRNGDTLRTTEKPISLNSVRPTAFKHIFTLPQNDEFSVQSTSYSPSTSDLPQIGFLVKTNQWQRTVLLREGVNETFADSIDQHTSVDVSLLNYKVKLPYSLRLDSFVIGRYPGSFSPSSFKSYITLFDHEKPMGEPVEIYMNNVLNRDGFRLYQASYDEDEKGTILMVNNDSIGSAVSYVGYFLLALGMILALFEKNSRFSKHVKRTAVHKVIAVLLLFISVSASSGAAVSTASSKKFGELLILPSDGRVRPFTTYAGEIVRKLSKGYSPNGLSNEQLVLEIIRNESTATIDFLYKPPTGIDAIDQYAGKYISFNGLFDTQGNYVLEPYVNSISRKLPAKRSKLENNMLALDERANIYTMLRNGKLLNMFPLPGKDSQKWLDMRDAATVFMQNDTMLQQAFGVFYSQFFSHSDEQFSEAVSFIDDWQEKFAVNTAPSNLKRKGELVYERLNVFTKLGRIYAALAFVFIVSAIAALVSHRKIWRFLSTVMSIHLKVAVVLHALALMLRGFISGHIPLSNGYETMLYVAFISLVLGVVVSRKSKLSFALLALVAASSMMVAQSGLMNPQITPLVPVLKSVWLNIHVTVITSSYAFFAGVFVLSVGSLVALLFLNHSNKVTIFRLVTQLTNINRMLLIPGLYLLTIGCFLGGVWANQSWGRYWSWDPKETWCLVSILIYGFVAHLHHIPGVKGRFAYIVGSMFAFTTILMTYFGVNYFLGGLHSYAGDGAVYSLLPFIIPVFLLLVIVLLARTKYRKYAFDPIC